MAHVTTTLKISPSSENEGTVFLQVAHRGSVRKLSTKCKIFRNEWHSGTILVPKSGDRVEAVTKIHRKINTERQRLCRVVKILDSRSIDYTADDIISEYRRYMHECTLFKYMNARGASAGIRPDRQRESSSGNTAEFLELS